MKYAKLTLKGRFRETGSQVSSLASAAGKDFRFDQFLMRVQKLLHMQRVQRILIVCDPEFQPVLWGGAEAVRTQLQRLSEAGKELWFYAREYRPLELYLASACSRKVLHPLGSLSYLGLSRSFLFFKKAMSRADIDAEIIRRGEYKSAGDRFRTDQLDEPGRRQYQAYFDSVSNELKEKIGAVHAGGYVDRYSEIEALQAGTILPAASAELEGWVDAVKTLDRLEAEWKEEKYKKLSLKKPGRAFVVSLDTSAAAGDAAADSGETGTAGTQVDAGADTAGGAGKQTGAVRPHLPRPLLSKPRSISLKRRKKIAVLVFEGAIIDGKSKQHPLLGQAIGPESFIPHIRKLEEDKAVKGVVLRVNSGGGSATASEDILDALARLREKKPLVVSMSEVAGSGGYWIATQAERIFAHHATLTGSIGVILMFFYLEKFLKKHGITASSLKTGPYADLGSVLRSMDKRERELMDAEVERIYLQFLERVSRCRGRSEDEIDAVAQGRVWSGFEARQQHLIDEIGGIESAVAFLLGKLEISKAKVQFYPRVKRSFLAKQLEKAGQSEAHLPTAGPLAGSLFALGGSNLVGPGPEAGLADGLLPTPAQLLQFVREYSARPLAAMPEWWLSTRL
ncbi:MAG: signal peptide peptidase SppA [Spirochaetota bacterium]